jgi:hypothetical protein
MQHRTEHLPLELPDAVDLHRQRREVSAVRGAVRQAAARNDRPPAPCARRAPRAPRAPRGRSPARRRWTAVPGRRWTAPHEAFQQAQGAIRDLLLQEQNAQRGATLAGAVERRFHGVEHHLLGQRGAVHEHRILAAGLGDERGDGAVARRQRRLIRRATSVEPVKATPADAGIRQQRGAKSGPLPGSRCSTSPGTPAACNSRTAAAATSGVCSAGLASTALPVTSAAATWPVKIASGKFHGLMHRNTPRPCHDSRCSRRSGPAGAPAWRRPAAPARRNSAGNPPPRAAPPRSRAASGRPRGCTARAARECSSNRSAARVSNAARELGAGASQRGWAAAASSSARSASSAEVQATSPTTRR